MAQWHLVVYCSGLHEQPTCCVLYSQQMPPTVGAQPTYVLGAIMRLSRTRSRVCSLGYRCVLFLIFNFIHFYPFLYISDWLTIYDRAAPTRTQHDPQWPVKLRRTQ